VLVDTSVWSLALRRKPKDLNLKERRVVGEWSELVREGRLRLIGPVRQELLSGIRRREAFTALEQRLAAFPDAPVSTEDYVEAARFFNRCRARGLAGTPVDLLICAVAHRFGWTIFSTDEDFGRYRGLLPVRLHPITRAFVSPARISS